jgi:hypothetical protein
MTIKKENYSKYTNSQKMALLKKQQADYNKKFKNMTPAQKKAKLVGDAKKIGLTAAQVASMVGGAGVARAGAAKVGAKIVASGVTKKTAMAARQRGKEYMAQKYFERGMSTPTGKWANQAKPKVPKKEEFAKVAGNAKEGKSARLNPVGRTARAAANYERKSAGRVKKNTAENIKKFYKGDMRTARGVANKSLNGKKK